MKTETLKNIVVPIIILLSLLGVADTSYLLYSHFSEVSVLCTEGSECSFVLTSEYSEFLGIPVALFGFLYYLTILISAFIYLKKEDLKFMNFISKISPIGLIASLYFIYLQLFVIYAICTYCMASAGLSITIFIIGMLHLFFQSKRNDVI
jgi:uncharacterized membrane protein